MNTSHINIPRALTDLAMFFRAPGEVSAVRVYDLGDAGYQLLNEYRGEDVVLGAEPAEVQQMFAHFVYLAEGGKP